MVRNSLLLHRRRGTPWAVRRALEIALRMPVTVREWFETGGEPYSFTLELDVTDSGLSDDMLANVSRIVANEKNVRSWLRHASTATNLDLPLRHGLAVVCATRSEIKPWEPTGEAPDFSLRHGLAAVGRTLAEYAASNPETTAPALGARTALAVSGCTMATIH